MALNYTNEGCAGGGYRFLKNIMGLWIIQECRKQWNTEGKRLNFTEISNMAERARPFTAFIDLSDEVFFPPGDMPKRVREYCARTGQIIPETETEIARCVFDSLAFKYRWTLEGLEELTKRNIEMLHIVGGGSRNGLLNQLSANALKCPVVAGPVEATAVGNLIVQAIALGEVADIPQARSVIRESFSTEKYIPQNSDSWDEAYNAFKIVTCS